MSTRRDAYLAPGTKVRHDGLGPDKPEYGVVVHCWKEPDHFGGMYDCYVAFFGDEFPAGQPVEKPYVLRYAAKSLVALD